MKKICKILTTLSLLIINLKDESKENYGLHKCSYSGQQFISTVVKRGVAYHSECMVCLCAFMDVGGGGWPSESSTAKQSGQGETYSEKRGLEKWICFSDFSGDVNSHYGLHYICFFLLLVLRYSAASHATRGQRSAVMSQGGPLEERRGVRGGSYS